SPSFVSSSGQPTAPACGGTVSTNCYMTYDMAANDPLGKGLDKLMQSQIKLTDLPNDYSGGDGFNTATFRFNAPPSSPQDTDTTKADCRFNASAQPFFRTTWGHSDLIGDYINTGLGRYPANPASFPGRTRESSSLGFSAGATSVLGASKVNEFNFGYTRNS